MVLTSTRTTQAIVVNHIRDDTEYVNIYQRDGRGSVGEAGFAVLALAKK